MQQFSSVIYVGGPDRARLVQALHALLTGPEGLCVEVKNPQRKEGRRLVDDHGEPASVRVFNCRRDAARVLASRARKLARNAHAHCLVVEEPIA